MARVKWTEKEAIYMQLRYNWGATLIFKSTDQKLDKKSKFGTTDQELVQ